MIGVDSNKLLLHRRTKLQFKAFVKAPSHGLMIIGAPGSGRKTAAKDVASQLLEISPSALSSYPYFFRVAPEDKKEILIDQVRGLINKLKLKVPGSKSIRKVIFIDGADKMSLEAQNALLKVLEEPSDDTVFILTAPSDRSVLSTIASRVQHIYLRRVSIHDAHEYYRDEHPSSELERAWRLSQGNVGLLQSLLSDIDEHELSSAIKSAKNFLRQSRYERLLTLEPMSRDKLQLETFLDALSKVLTALHHSAINKNKSSQAAKLLADRKQVIELREALTANANPKLIILKLSTSLNI